MDRITPAVEAGLIAAKSRKLTFILWMARSAWSASQTPGRRFCCDRDKGRFWETALRRAVKAECRERADHEDWPVGRCKERETF